MTVNGGDIIFASDFNNILPKVAWKTATTTRTSTTTVSNDPDLSGITLGIGTYTVEGLFMFYGAEAGDIKFNWAFTGTCTAINRANLGPEQPLTGTPDNELVRIGGTTMTGGYGYGIPAATAIGNARETFILEVTASGDLSVQWAQNVSNGTGTQLIQGSYVRVIPFS